MLVLRSYLEGTRFTVRTDYEALKWILILAEGTGTLARWGLRLFEMNFDIVPCAEINNQAADALLQASRTGEDCKSTNKQLLAISISSLPKDGRKGRIIPNDTIDDCKNTSVTATCPRFPAVCVI